MNRRRMTKIVATLGPASMAPDTMRAFLRAGVDVFRMNFSHGSHDEYESAVAALRALESELGRPVGILADLQGPKLRIGAFAAGSITLEAGAAFRLRLREGPGSGRDVSLPHPEVFAALHPGVQVLLNDGRIRLEVQSATNDTANTRVITGGELSDHKGVNVPKVALPIPALTTKDRVDLEFALALGVNWVGLSFVQRPEDVLEAREFIADRASVLAKLERPMAIDRLDEIVEVSDALMVARGDLGVEMPFEEVPGIQKQIVRLGRTMGKPVVVATQMLDSMVFEPVPTRAEVSDVATAVYDGADAVMLSAESATGMYPVEAVETMSRIIEQVERDPLYRTVMDAEHPAPLATEADAITAAARQVAETIGAAAIVTYTTSGSTALRASRERPRVPILSLAPVRATAQRLALAWGVQCVHSEDAEDFTDMVEKAVRSAVAEGLAEKGSLLVVTAGVPFGTPGATNTLRIIGVE